MKNRIFFYACSALLSLYFILKCNVVLAQKDSVYEKGKTHFRELCSSCHSPHQEVYGPMLGSITKKRTEDWLITFIQNSQQVIKSGDPYAVELFEKFEHQTMPSFEYLSREDIKSILHYLEVESIQTKEHLNDLAIPETADSSIIQGKQEFINHCAVCHFIHKESTFAPALGSVTKRHSREWLISFIKNSQKKIKSGDPYAKHLFNAFDQHVMTTMEFLEEEEIHSILNFIEYASTANVAYEGKINKAEYQNQAGAEIKEEIYSGNRLNVILQFAFILVTLFLMIFLIAVLYRYFIRNKKQ